MKQLILIVLTSIFAFSSLIAATNIIDKKTIKPGSSSSIIKKKAKDPCSAMESSIRNIRSIKLLTQELDKYDNRTLLECLNKLAADPSLRIQLKRLEPYLKSRSKSTGKYKLLRQ